MTLRPIAPNLWIETPAGPRLVGARFADGSITFPIPEGETGKDAEVVELSPRGRLWSWTSQDFRPKSPYDGPDSFEPYILGYIELPSQVIVETRIEGVRLDQLALGMEMKLVVVPFDHERSIFAFTPEAVQ